LLAASIAARNVQFPVPSSQTPPVPMLAPSPRDGHAIRDPRIANENSSSQSEGQSREPTELGNERLKMSRLSAGRAYSGCQLYRGRHRDFQCARGSGVCWINTRLIQQSWPRI